MPQIIYLAKTSVTILLPIQLAKYDKWGLGWKLITMAFPGLPLEIIYKALAILKQDITFS